MRDDDTSGDLGFSRGNFSTLGMKEWSAGYVVEYPTEDGSYCAHNLTW